MTSAGMEASHSLCVGFSQTAVLLIASRDLWLALCLIRHMNVHTGLRNISRKYFQDIDLVKSFSVILPGKPLVACVLIYN